MKCTIYVLLFWAAAAALVLASSYEAAKIGAVVLVSFAYIRWTARDATLEHALLVGAAWLVLAIVVEVFEASTTGRGWFDLVGSPAHPVARAALLAAWVGAPALFVRGSAC